MSFKFQYFYPSKHQVLIWCFTQKYNFCNLLTLMSVQNCVTYVSPMYRQETQFFYVSKKKIKSNSFGITYGRVNDIKFFIISLKHITIKLKVLIKLFSGTGNFSISFIHLICVICQVISDGVYRNFMNKPTAVLLLSLSLCVRRTSLSLSLSLSLFLPHRSSCLTHHPQHWSNKVAMVTQPHRAPGLWEGIFHLRETSIMNYLFCSSL